MALTGRERRELREIEHALMTSDPDLAALFTQAAAEPAAQRATRAERKAHRARITAGAFVAVAVLLISAGLVVHDSGMLVGGCLVLLMMPLTVCLIAAAGSPRAPGERQ